MGTEPRMASPHDPNSSTDPAGTVVGAVTVPSKPLTVGARLATTPIIPAIVADMYGTVPVVWITTATVRPSVRRRAVAETRAGLMQAVAGRVVVVVDGVVSVVGVTGTDSGG
jgi:hypothetical protein